MTYCKYEFKTCPECGGIMLDDGTACKQCGYTEQKEEVNDKNEGKGNDRETKEKAREILFKCFRREEKWFSRAKIFFMVLGLLLICTFIFVLINLENKSKKEIVEIYTNQDSWFGKNSLLLFFGLFSFTIIEFIRKFKSIFTTKALWREMVKINFNCDIFLKDVNLWSDGMIIPAPNGYITPNSELYEYDAVENIAEAIMREKYKEIKTSQTIVKILQILLFAVSIFFVFRWICYNILNNLTDILLMGLSSLSLLATIDIIVASIGLVLYLALGIVLKRREKKRLYKWVTDFKERN